MAHKGEIIEKAVRESGIKISALAKQLGISRRHLYNIFDYAELPAELILKIGRIINFDFSGSITIYPDYQEPAKTSGEGDVDYNENVSWKEKYLGLLEKYNELQAKYIEMLEKTRKLTLKQQKKQRLSKDL